MGRAWITKNDTWLIIGLLLLALAVYVFFSLQDKPVERYYAEVKYDGEAVMTISMDSNTTYSKLFELNQHPEIVFQVRNGKIAFIQSDCPDQICVKTGSLNKVGQMAVCLPNRVSLAIGGYGGEHGFDMVGY